MYRTVVRMGVASVGWLLAAALGLTAAGLRTPAGRDVVSRQALQAANDAINGSLTVGAIGGSFLTGLEIEQLLIRDTSGAVVARIPRASIQYGLRDLLGGRIVLGKLTVEEPEIHLVERPGRGLNAKELFASAGGEASDVRGGPGPLVAFRDVAVSGGTVVIESPDRVRRVEGLHARLPYLRLASPLPNERGLRLDIADLRATVSDPAVEILGARGVVQIRGDSIHVDMATLRLPRTGARVVGVLVPGQGGLRYDLAIEADSIATDELRGLVSELPAGMAASGALKIQTDKEVLEFRGEQLAVEGLGNGGRAEGRLGLTLGPGDGWAFRDTRLQLENFDLEYVRAFFDTLPIAGRMTGRFEADGPKEQMRLGLSLVFRDSLVDGWPENVIDGSGIVSVGVPGDIVFRDFGIDDASLDLGTVRGILPAIDLQGLVLGSGVLNGPWLQLAYEGSIRHVDLTSLVSNADGTVRIDARGDTLGLWAELAFDSLNLDALHTTYPSLTVGGAFAGRGVVTGYLDSLLLAATLEGPAGALFVDGAVTLLEGRRGVLSADVRAARLNLKQLHQALPVTRLFGRARGFAVEDSVLGIRSGANAELRASTVEGVLFDSLLVDFVTADSALQVNTLEAWGRDLHFVGGGDIGMVLGTQGRLTLATEADSLEAIEPWLARVFGPLDEEARRLGQPFGWMRLELEMQGSLQDFTLSANGSIRNADRADLFVSDVRVAGTWSNASDRLRLVGEMDSVEVRGWGASDGLLRVEGHRDSLQWFGRVNFGVDGYGAAIAGGRFYSSDGVVAIPIDSMGFQLASGAWFAEVPAEIRISERVIDLARLEVSSVRRAGVVTVSGGIPRREAAAMRASVEAVPVEDLWMLLQREYRDVSGEISGTFSLDSSAAEPVMQLFVNLRNGSFGTVRAPQVLGRLTYQDRGITGEFQLMRSGTEILNARLSLPVDLALKPVPRRQLPGPISAVVLGTGVDLSVLNAMTPLVRRAEGTLDADFGIAGTWDNPELTGSLTITDAAASLPALGVRHEGVNGSFRMRGDTIGIEHLTGTSGRGTATVTGFVRLEELSRPILELGIQTQDFHGVDVPGFLSLTASGNLELRGPVFGATLTGAGTVTRGVLYFADLVEKEIINLEDSLFAGLEFVDTTAIRQQGLGTQFEIRFLDSLRVDSLDLQMGSDVWMRSSEANIQLAGAVTVYKERGEYRLNGTLQTPRGTYRLSPGLSLFQLVATKEFAVTGGEITYFGTPDLDAALDIQARHVVRGLRGENITVFVHMGGTVYEPRLTFSSDARPPISETEILSYLFFGAPSVEAFAGTGSDQRFVEQGLTQFLNALSGQLEYSLISDLRVPLDYVQIRPSVLGTGLAGTEIALGKRIGERWFVTVSRRVCPQEPVFALEKVGASLEYQISRQWLFSVSADPVQSCAPLRTRSLTTPYQLGGDLFWEKRY